MKRNLPLVVVEWIDAESRHAGWERAADALREAGKWCQNTTAGYLLRRDDKAVMLVMNVSNNGDVSDTFTIPAGWVTKVRRIKGERVSVEE